MNLNWGQAQEEPLPIKSPLIATELNVAPLKVSSTHNSISCYTPEKTQQEQPVE